MRRKKAFRLVIRPALPVRLHLACLRPKQRHDLEILRITEDLWHSRNKWKLRNGAGSGSRIAASGRRRPRPQLRQSCRRLQAELEKARTERAAFLDRAARLQAEFDNFRKRNAKEQQDYRDYALADALKSLLPILDSLDRALKTDAASLEDFHAGIELIDKQFHDALAKLGVQPIPAEASCSIPICIRRSRWSIPTKPKTIT